MLTSPLDNISWTNSFQDMKPCVRPPPPPCLSRLEVKKVKSIDTRKIASIIRGFIGGGPGGCCCLFGSSS